MMIMSFFSSSPPSVPPVPPPPKEDDEAVKAAARKEAERLRKAKGRQAMIATSPGGLLGDPETQAGALKTKLGE